MSATDCYGCATQRHSCEHDDAEPYNTDFALLRKARAELARLHTVAATRNVSVEHPEWLTRSELFTSMLSLDRAINAMETVDAVHR